MMTLPTIIRMMRSSPYLRAKTPKGTPTNEPRINFKASFQTIFLNPDPSKQSASVSPDIANNGVAVFTPEIIVKKGNASNASPNPKVANTVLAIKMIRIISTGISTL